MRNNRDRYRHVCIYTRCVQKVSRILCFFKNYLLIHKYLFDHLQSNPHQILYTCAKVFSNPRSTSKIIFWDLVQLLLRFRLYLLNRSLASSFRGPLQFREQEKVTGRSDLQHMVAAALLLVLSLRFQQPALLQWYPLFHMFNKWVLLINASRNCRSPKTLKPSHDYVLTIIDCPSILSIVYLP